MVTSLGGCSASPWCGLSEDSTFQCDERQCDACQPLHEQRSASRLRHSCMMLKPRSGCRSSNESVFKFFIELTINHGGHCRLSAANAHSALDTKLSIEKNFRLYGGDWSAVVILSQYLFAPFFPNGIYEAELISSSAFHCKQQLPVTQLNGILREYFQASSAISTTKRPASFTRPRAPPEELVPARNPVWRAESNRPHQLGELVRMPLSSVTDRGHEAQDIHKYLSRKYSEPGTRHSMAKPDYHLRVRHVFSYLRK